MKNIFTFSTAKSKALLFGVMFCFALGANATSTYYYFFDEFHPYPTGAGKIYVSGDKTLDESTITEWTEYHEESFCEYGIGGHDFYIYTQPAEGWLALGVSTGTRVDELSDWEPTTDEEGNEVISNQETPFRFTPTSNIKDNDSLTCVSMAPMFPDACAFLVFTHVAPRVAAGQKSFGSATASKTVNYVGDNIQLKATPADERCHFSKWVRKSDGKEFLDNPLFVDVTGAEEYFAYFDCDSATVLSSKEGEYFVWYDDDSHTVTTSDETTIYAFSNDGLQVTDEGNFYVEPRTNSTTFYAGAPMVVYVKGDAYACRTPQFNSFYSLTNPLALWSGEEGLASSEIDPVNSYFVVNAEKQQFVLLDDVSAGIAPKTMYLALPTLSNFGEDVPSIIYWSKEAASADGISQVEIEKAEQTGKVYNINGVRIESLGRNGIYIIDGKKYVNKSR